MSLKDLEELSFWRLLTLQNVLNVCFYVAEALWPALPLFSLLFKIRYANIVSISFLKIILFLQNFFMMERTAYGVFLKYEAIKSIKIFNLLFKFNSCLLSTSLTLYIL